MTRSGLREQVLRGGVYLGARQLLGAATSIVGAFMLLRLIGPREYGLYAAAIGFFTALQLVAQLGIGAYLVRREAEESTAVLDQATGLLAVLASAGLLLGVVTLPVLAGWSRLEGVSGPMLALYMGLPVVALAQVPIAALDRRLAYRRVAWLELGGQVAFFVASIALAVREPNVWAPVIGWWIQQAVVLVGACRLASYRPRLAFDAREWADMLRYGVEYSAAIWVYQLRRAANPLVVGRLLGAEAVGVVALCAQLVTHLSFAAVASSRLSAAAFARVQQEPDRLVRAINESMRLQLPAVAPFLLVFAWFGPWLLATFLGPEWAQVPEIFPYLAAGTLFGAIFTMQSSALLVIHKGWEVARVHLVQLAVLAAVGTTLVPLVGLAGWGWAELSMISAFPLLHAATTRAIRRPTYGVSLLLAITAGIAMFAIQLGPLALLPFAAAVLASRPWREVHSALSSLRSP